MTATHDYPCHTIPGLVWGQAVYLSKPRDSLPFGCLAGRAALMAQTLQNLIFCLLVAPALLPLLVRTSQSWMSPSSAGPRPLPLPSRYAPCHSHTAVPVCMSCPSSATMDPVSAAASVISIVDVSLRTTSALIKYIKATKDASSERRLLADAAVQAARSPARTCRRSGRQMGSRPCRSRQAATPLTTIWPLP